MRREYVKWLECDPLPEACRYCLEEECYNCDIAGKRWVLSREDTLQAQRMLKLQAIQRLQREVAEIDAKLRELMK